MNPITVSLHYLLCTLHILSLYNNYQTITLVLYYKDALFGASFANNYS